MRLLAPHQRDPSATYQPEIFSLVAIKNGVPNTLTLVRRYNTDALKVSEAYSEVRKSLYGEVEASVAPVSAILRRQLRASR
jgi:hypothetical protein